MPTENKRVNEKSGLQLVSSTRTPRPDERRLSLGGYTADIVVSNREENCCYYVLQRMESAEIIDMQRFETAGDAEAAAYAALTRWNGEELIRQLLTYTSNYKRPIDSIFDWPFFSQKRKAA